MNPVIIRVKKWVNPCEKTIDAIRKGGVIRIL